MIKDKKFILRIALIAFLIASFFIPFGIKTTGTVLITVAIFADIAIA